MAANKLSPTAELAVVRERLALAETAAVEAHRKAEATLASVDAEALALSRCIKALDELIEQSSRYSATPTGPRSTGTDAIKRVLGHLAARYGGGA